jgi:carboxymethylenebutenolidase
MPPLSALLAGIGLALGAASAESAPACRAIEYPSGARPVGAYLCVPPGRAPRAGIVVLHGADGPQRNGGAYRRATRELAERGYAALFVDYFSQSGLPDRRGVRGDPARALALYSTWTHELADGVRFLAAQPGVDRNRLGLLGFSLGSYLGLAFAAQSGLNSAGGGIAPRAVVSYYGGLAWPFEGLASHLPPVLILHGERDALVPVSEAHRLERLLKEHRRPYQLRIYPKQGHGFVGETARDAWKQTLSFFAQYLTANAAR